MESGGAASLPQDGAKLARLAAIAEAVSQQKQPSLSSSPNTTEDDNINIMPAVTNDNLLQQQQYTDSPPSSSIADILRRKNTGIIPSTLTQTDVAAARAAAAAASAGTGTAAAAVVNNPASRFQLPSMMASIGQHQQQASLQQQHPPSSLYSRKRPRVEYGLSNEEQRGAAVAPSMIGLGGPLTIQHLQQQIQQPKYQHQHLPQHEQPHHAALPSRITINTNTKTDTNTTGTATGIGIGIGIHTQPSFEGVRFREYQAEIWSEKFEELCTFRRFHGHCHVPHHYNQNAGLAQWVKRQRYQYKLKLDNKRSTLSDERVRLLNKIGFIWNSHDAVWEERLQDLLAYKRVHGHCIVPSNFESNPQLAVWTKRQRRQYKKYQDGSSSSMTPERIAKLETIGFVWDCRKINRADDVRGDAQGVGETAAAAAAAAVSTSSGSSMLWPKTMGSVVAAASTTASSAPVASSVGISNHCRSSSINTNTTGMNDSTAPLGPILTNSPVGRWSDTLLPTPIGGGGGNDQRLGAYSNQQDTTTYKSAEDMPSISDYPYSSSIETNMRQSTSTGGSLAISIQGYTSTATNTPTIESNEDGVATSQKPSSSSSAGKPPVIASSTRKEEDPESSDDSCNNDDEPRLSWKQKPKTPKCEFFSFSRKFPRDENGEKKPS